MVERSPEKAGVGGSTPSLATIIPKNLFELPGTGFSPLSVRIWNARKKTDADVYDLEEPILVCIPSQSAVSPFLPGAWLRIAVSIFPAATMRSRLTAWV